MSAGDGVGCGGVAGNLCRRLRGLACARLLRCLLCRLLGLLRGLPLMLTSDIGDVGLVWRDQSPGPALSLVLQAFTQVAAQAVPPG